MALHVFGAIVTGYGCAANNRGETEGNITTLQKLLWKGNVHTTVSSEAIRWALRYHRQQSVQTHELNRTWDDEKNDLSFSDQDYKAWHPTKPEGDTLWDDDLFGFMDASASSEESELQNEIPRVKADLETKQRAKPNDEKLKKKLSDFEKNLPLLRETRQKLAQAEDTGEEANKNQLEKEVQSIRKKLGLKSIAVVRRGVLEVARAISTTPFAGDLSFNAKSGKKDRTSLYGTEIHSTRYQYGFAMTPERLRVQKRCLDALDAFGSLGEVAGNQSRFLFDFSPESIVIRITHDPAPRILYCFEETNNFISVPELLKKIAAGDIKTEELFIGGLLADSKEIKELNIPNCFPGIKTAIETAKTKIEKEREELKNQNNKTSGKSDVSK